MMPYQGYISETIRCRQMIFGRDIGQGYKCAMSWCDLDFTFDLAYLMLFYLSTLRSDTILSLLYLSHIFLLESWLLHLCVSLMYINHC